jgi:hypothetical protein
LLRDSATVRRLGFRRGSSRICMYVISPFATARIATGFALVGQRDDQSKTVAARRRRQHRRICFVLSHLPRFSSPDCPVHSSERLIVEDTQARLDGDGCPDRDAECGGADRSCKHKHQHARSMFLAGRRYSLAPIALASAIASRTRPLPGRLGFGTTFSSSPVHHRASISSPLCISFRP